MAFPLDARHVAASYNDFMNEFRITAGCKPGHVWSANGFTDSIIQRRDNAKLHRSQEIGNIAFISYFFTAEI